MAVQACFLFSNCINTPERPNARLEDIPAGARFNEPEISAALTRDVVSGLLSSVKASVCQLGKI